MTLSVASLTLGEYHVSLIRATPGTEFHLDLSRRAPLRVPRIRGYQDPRYLQYYSTSPRTVYPLCSQKIVFASDGLNYIKQVGQLSGSDVQSQVH
jgi:hypothetical protein